MAFDSSENKDESSLLVCGTTTSVSLAYSMTVQKCTDNPVPFVWAYDPVSEIQTFKAFWSTVTYPPDSSYGLFTEALACKMSNRNTWNNESTLAASVVILKYQALASQTQPTSMFMVSMTTASLTVSKVEDIQGTITDINDILFTLSGDGDFHQDSLKLFYFDSASTTFAI